MTCDKQGVNQDRYVLIPRTLIFLTRENAVLLLKGAPDKQLWTNLYNGIGGHIERGEGVITSAAREIHEETGLQPNNLWICGVVTIDTSEDAGIVLFILRGDGPHGELKASKEGSLQWVPFNQLQDLPLVEDLKTLLPQVISLDRSDPPFSAHYSYDNGGNLLIDFDQPQKGYTT